MGRNWFNLWRNTEDIGKTLIELEYLDITKIQIQFIFK